MTRFSSAVGLCLSGLLLAACDGDRAALARRADSPETKRLVGTWDARFQIERPLLIGSPPKQHEVKGQLAMLANRSLIDAYPTMELPTDYGTFDIDFTPFGFDGRADGQTPTVFAAWRGADSLDIVLGEPDGDISVRMHGRFLGDSIVGTWRVLISRTGGGGGSFVLVKH